MQKYTNMAELRKAVQFFGSQYKMAKALGITSQAVNSWVKEKTDVSLKAALKIETLTNGKIKARSLRNDI